MARTKRRARPEEPADKPSEPMLQPQTAPASPEPTPGKRKRPLQAMEASEVTHISQQEEPRAEEAPQALQPEAPGVHQPEQPQPGHDRQEDVNNDQGEGQTVVGTHRPSALSDGDDEGAEGGAEEGAEEEGAEQEGPEEGAEEGGEEGGPPKKRKKVLSEERLRRLKEEHDRRGIVFISRIPPHMKPMKLKQLLSQHGETLRVYCAPEDPSARRARKKKGGNTGKNFTEGWVEFADKRIAKRVALMLNGQRIGGKRRSAYYDDLWCLKYLKHFKWDHLTEEINYQKAVREQRLATEITAAKRERDHYLAQVDQSKAMAAMAERRAAKEATQAGAGGAGSTGGPAGAKPSSGAGAAAAGGAAKQGDGAAAGPGAAAGAGAGTGGGRFKNRDLGQRQPRADPAQGGPTGREISDDVLMMVARKRKA